MEDYVELLWESYETNVTVHETFGHDYRIKVRWLHLPNSTQLAVAGSFVYLVLNTLELYTYPWE